jgi:Icc-related predicted phosphoesterase
MKILALGDPHGKLPKNIDSIVKKNKVCLILITGDIGKADLARKRFFENQKRLQIGLEEIEDDKRTIKKIYYEIHESTYSIIKRVSKIAPTYSIQGNVSIPSGKEIKKKLEIKIPCTMDLLKKMKSFHLVKNRVLIINNLRVGFLEYFTDVSYVKEFKPKDYKESMSSAKVQTEKVKKVLKRFKNLDILICHQPPYGYLDKVNFPGIPKNWKGKNAGSKVILEYIKKYQPKIVLCGHIHEAKGEVRIGKTKVYNLGCCGDYKIIKF